MPATKIVLDPILQLQDLLILQTCHSLHLRRPPRILVDLHKSRRYREVAVAHISDTPPNRGLLNNALNNARMQRYAWMRTRTRFASRGLDGSHTCPRCRIR